MSTIASMKELLEKAEKEGGALVNLEPGTYTLRVKSVKHNTTKGYLSPLYEVVDGEKAGVSVMVGVLSYKETALNMTFQKLAKFGLGSDFLSSIPGTSEGWDTIGKALVGRVVQAQLGVQGQDAGEFAGRNEFADYGKHITLLSAPDMTGAATPAGTPPPPPPAPPAGAAAPPAETATASGAITPPPPPPPAPVAAAAADAEPAF